jgi:hypothetical protein
MPAGIGAGSDEMKNFLLIAGFLITAVSMAGKVWLVDASQTRQEHLSDEIEAITSARNLSAQYLFESTAAMQAAAQLYTTNIVLSGRPETGIRVSDLVVDSLNRTTSFGTAALRTLREVEPDRNNDAFFAESCRVESPVGQKAELDLIVRLGDSGECKRPAGCAEASWLGCGDEAKELLIDEMQGENPSYAELRCRYDQLRQADHAFGVEWRRIDRAMLKRYESLSCRLRHESARTDFHASILTVVGFLGIMIAFTKDLFSA